MNEMDFRMCSFCGALRQHILWCTEATCPSNIFLHFNVLFLKKKFIKGLYLVMTHDILRSYLEDQMSLAGEHSSR
jgi:hypothetical protein